MLDKNNVTYCCESYRAMLEDWTFIGDSLGGQRSIKAKREKYLRHPGSANPDDVKAHKDRYNDYLHRALYYDVPAKTLRGLVGEVFSRDATYELPEQLKKLLKNIDGEGRTIDQVAKTALQMCLSKGRGALLADYPKMPDGETASVADLDKALVRPRILLFRPEQVINWRVVSFGAQSLLSLVVIKERAKVHDDGYEEKMRWQWRVLRLNKERIYTVQIFIENEHQTQIIPEGEEFAVTDAEGNTFDVIPFTFLGPEDNGPEPNMPPILGLCNLAVAHYCDTAKYHDSVDIVGDPTLKITGVSEEWVEKVWKKNKVRVGCRSVLSLPKGADAAFLQVEPNTLVKEAMDKKELQMVALGAKLVEQRSVQRTATEAGQDEAAKTSTLGSSANNVSEALTFMFRCCNRFIPTGFAEDKVEYLLNTDFDISKMDPATRAQTVAEYQADLLTWEEARHQLRRAGSATEDDKKALAKIESDPLKEAKMEAELSLKTAAPPKDELPGGKKTPEGKKDTPAAKPGNNGE